MFPSSLTFNLLSKGTPNFLTTALATVNSFENISGVVVVKISFGMIIFGFQEVFYLEPIQERRKHLSQGRICKEDSNF